MKCIYRPIILFLLMLVASTLFSSDNFIRKNQTEETTIFFINKFDWIQAQFKHSIKKPNDKPQIKVRNIKIASLQKITSAYDVVSGDKLSIEKLNNKYYVSVPNFSTVKAINIRYEHLDSNTNHYDPLIAKISKLERINAFAHITSKELSNKLSRYTDVEKKLSNMGFRAYVRNVKHTGKSQETLWNSQAVITKNGSIAYKSNTDLVSVIAKNAKNNKLEFFSYYKDTGDEHVLHSHPEWECKNVIGTPTHGRFIFLDFTSPYKEVVLAQLKELAQKGVKGIYFDYIHMPLNGCFGTNLENLFTKKTGLKVPKNTRHKNHSRYLEFQANLLSDTFLYWKKEMKKDYPDVLFIISTAYISGLTRLSHSSKLAEIADITKVEFESGRRSAIRADVFKKSPSLAKPDKQLLMTLAITRPRDLSGGQLTHVWSNRLPNTDHLKSFVSTTIALGGIAAIHIDNEYLKNGFNPQKHKSKPRVTPYNAFDPAIKLGNKLSSIMKGKAPAKYAAVLFSDQLRSPYKKNYEQAWRSLIWPSVGAYQGFLDLGVPVSVISDNKLLVDLLEYKVLFLPTTINSLSKPQKEMVLLFKNKGGAIIENQSLKWRWDSPKTNTKARRDFLTYLKKNIKLPVIHILKDDPDIYTFMYKQY